MPDLTSRARWNAECTVATVMRLLDDAVLVRNERTRALLRRLLGTGPTEERIFDGADLTEEGLMACGALSVAEPAWWDTESKRIVVPHASLRECSLRSTKLATLACERLDLAGADLANANLAGAMLGGAVFDEALLEDADLSGAHLRFASFRRTVLESTRLRESDLRGAILSAAVAYRSIFQGADLEEADCTGFEARECDFRGCRMAVTSFRNADLRESDLRDATLRQTRFDGADLRGTRLDNLDLSRCQIEGARLADADLDRTKMNRAQLGRCIVEEAEGQFELARRAYLALERNFSDIGDPDAASWAYVRRRRAGKMEARQQALRALNEGQWRRAALHSWQYASDKVVELTCGYGESIARVLLSLTTVFVGFLLFYGMVGGVVRDVPGGLVPQITRAPLDLMLFTLTAMLAPGDSPDALHPANAGILLVMMAQSFVAIFLIGLLGFVAGNRIRR